MAHFPTLSRRRDSLFLFYFLFLTLLLLTPSSQAIKFVLPSSHSPTTKCIWNWSSADTLVIVTVNVDLQTQSNTISKQIRDKQRIDMEIVDGSGSRNVYQSKRGIGGGGGSGNFGGGETRVAITTHADADLGVCFRNTLDPNVPESQAMDYTRSVDLDVDIGADAVDYNAIAKQESLSGLEVEMRKLESVVKEIVDELNYLKKRENKMRDTNESTNARVRYFSMVTTVTLLSLGVWQILHLRNYFRRKYLID